MLSELEIINGCKSYRQSAQKALYEKYAPLMRGVCSRYVYNQNDLKDVLQEGFLKVFDKIKEYKGNGSFEGWIKRVIVNHAINYYYKNRKHQQHLNIDKINETEFIDDNEQDEGELNVDEFKEIEITAEIVDKIGFSQTELLELLNQVPESFRLVFNLHCIEDFKHEEIAEILKIDINTSRTRLLRARKILKQLLYKMSIDKIIR